MRVVTAEQMRWMDSRTIQSFGLPGRVLMECAGRGAAQLLFDVADDVAGKRVGVLAGGGNNGGDGFVIARCLAQNKVAVFVYLMAARSRVSGDAAVNLELLDKLGVPVIELTADRFDTCRSEMGSMDCWVDAMLGTGLNAPVRGFYKDVIEFVNRAAKPVVAVDIASGVYSDTGQIGGAAIRAAATATFAFAKPGHFLYPGAACRGKLRVIDIGIPYVVARQQPADHHLIDMPGMHALSRQRPPDAHKGLAGHVLVIAGSPGKTGAAVMSAQSAMRAGAGLVTLGVPEALRPVVEPMAIESMTVGLAQTERGELAADAMADIVSMIDDKACLAIGPGIGTAAATRQLVTQLIGSVKTAMVIDADGLNCLAQTPDWHQSVSAPLVLTPHPGEMARLMDCSIDRIQTDRIGGARRGARRFNCVLALKGAPTIVAGPDGAVRINTSGNSGMAGGGMGDVLTGIIAGLIAQGYGPMDAACLAAYAHGLAADGLQQQNRPVGFLATEVMAAVPDALGRIFAGQPRERLQMYTDIEG